MRKNNKVIYTSLTGGYDELPQYRAIDSSFDYICFSNDYPPGSKIGHWLIKPIPFIHSSPIHLSRYAKLLPHNVIPEYEWSVWLDSNLVIEDDKFYFIVNKCIERGELWNGIYHPLTDCIYEDMKKCLVGAKIKYKEIKGLLNFLRKEDFPRHEGLFENNVILRKHNEPKIIEIDEAWWSFFVDFVRRDQLSLFYIFWKKKFCPGLLLPKDENTHNSSYFTFIPHKKPSIKKRIVNKIIRWQNILTIRLFNPFSF